MKASEFNWFADKLDEQAGVEEMSIYPERRNGFAAEKATFEVDAWLSKLK